VRTSAVAATLAVVSSVALAQQGWEATVSVPPARAGAKPWVTAAAAAKPKAVVDVAAKPDGKAAEPKAEVKPEAKPETAAIKGAAAQEYCTNIANAAADARFVWQKKVIAEMEQELAKRMTAMEEKAAELQKWLARREEFSKKANETLLRIYARMRPDAAAVQLAALDEETAASLLVRLEPRTASLILNEMEPGQAVRLTATISGAGKFDPAKSSKNPPEAKSK
jgi:flagellar motility protein MotE (MotC chaperone)